MELNADFTKRAAVHSERIDWQSSPMPGVERRMLDRIGGEVARATTIVRFAPDSAFSPHTHDGGEEFIVLDGVFQDEHGDFPAGSYIRNPPTSRHTPRSEPGCTIFVKLWQFDPDDRTEVRLAMDSQMLTPEPARTGVKAAVLHEDARETVRAERWDPATRVPLGHPGGTEVFVLEGSFEESGETFEKGSWLRLPQGADSEALTGPDGADVWVKTGHLAHVRKPSGN